MNTTYKSGTTCTETPSGTLKSGSIVTSQEVRQVTLADGAGISQAHQTFSDDQTLAISGSHSYDLHAFAGAVDALDSAYALAAIKILHIRNLATDPSAILTVEPDNSANPWTGANGTTTAIAVIPPGGELILFGPSAAGFPVSSSSKALKIINQSATVTAEYLLQVVGS